MRNAMRKTDIIDEIKRISSKDSLDTEDVRAVGEYLSELNEKDISELSDIFPALQEYKKAHTQANFQNLCIQAMEFCLEIYSTTQNEKEREVYKAIFSKLPL